jgi:hypothetical protein
MVGFAGMVSPMTRNDLDKLAVELIAADEDADPQRLAAIAWQLYGEVGIDQAEIERLHQALRPLRAPGRTRREPVGEAGPGQASRPPGDDGTPGT